MADPLAALESRLRAEFGAALADKDARLAHAEAMVVDLTGQVKQLTDVVQGAPDTLAQSHCSNTYFMREARHMMVSPEKEQEASDLQPSETTATNREDGYDPLIQVEHSRPAFARDGTINDLEGVHSLHESGEIEWDSKELPQDMWGIAIMILTYDLSALLGKQGDYTTHMIRLVYGMGCVALNLVLQISILFWVNQYVVGSSVFNIQLDYAQFHREIFDKQGNFLMHKWETWDGPRDDLCGAVLTKSSFLALVLFLWIGRMLSEFKCTVRLLWDIIKVPTIPYSSAASLSRTILTLGEDNYLIIGFNSCIRASIMILVIIPRFGICLYLAIVGMRWLTSTLSFGDLILNALALEFVIGIDEQILEFFMPATAVENIAALKFGYIKVGEAVDQMQKVRQGYVRNIGYFIFCLMAVLIYLRYLQQVLPFYPYDVGVHCGKWFEDRYMPNCHPFEQNCFPYGSTSDSINYAPEGVRDD